jgi:DNA-binding beta-propeller fold protein YncE
MGRSLIRLLPALLLLSTAPVSAGSYTLFESGSVRPLALSADGTRLFAVNIPDNRLEIFHCGAAGLTHESSVSVGLEPVAVAVKDAHEVWVVNHLSDSISVVDVAATPPRVARTLLVGDEPRDIVFAGPSRTLAFITTAHRGQNSPIDPQLATPSVGRADVWIFDATDLGDGLLAAPKTIVTLFGDTPRALAATADGSVVYAAVFHSGDQTTTLNEHAVCDGSVDAQCSVEGVTVPGGLPANRLFHTEVRARGVE